MAEQTVVDKASGNTHIWNQNSKGAVKWRWEETGRQGCYPGWGEKFPEGGRPWWETRLWGSGGWILTFPYSFGSPLWLFHAGALVRGKCICPVQQLSPEIISSSLEPVFFTSYLWFFTFWIFMELKLESSKLHFCVTPIEQLGAKWTFRLFLSVFISNSFWPTYPSCLLTIVTTAPASYSEQWWLLHSLHSNWVWDLVSLWGRIMFFFASEPLRCKPIFSVSYSSC